MRGGISDGSSTSGAVCWVGPRCRLELRGKVLVAPCASLGAPHAPACLLGRARARGVGVEGGDVVDGELADVGHAGLGAVHLHVQAQLSTERAHGGQPALVVGPAAAHEELHLGGHHLVAHLAQRADDAGEGDGDVGEVGDAAADEQRAPPAVRCGGGALQHGLGVRVRLVRVGRAAVLPVVAQLVRQAQVAHSVGVDDARAAAGDEAPHAAGRVENRQLQACAGALVHVAHHALVHAHRLAKGHRELELAPLLGVLEGGGVVQLAAHVERDGRARGVDRERVELHVAEVQLLKDGKHPADEGVQLVAVLGGHAGCQGRQVHAVDGVQRVDRQALHGVPVVLHLDAARLGEQDGVAQPGGLNGEVELLAVRHKRLHDEGVHLPGAAVHLDLLAQPPLHKHLHLVVAQVQAHQVVLAALAKQHVGLHHQPLRLHPRVCLYQLGEVRVEAYLCGVRGEVNASQLAQPLLQQRLRGVLAHLLAGHRAPAAATRGSVKGGRKLQKNEGRRLAA
mmetsp:Transcript_32634/g.83375  ORF Transcript_32634/g.83375 Transcript_32634/m.83375 type:complete len:509 (-) Transcript_32634:43-1569(-)